MTKLIDKKELKERHPALKKGWRIDWLIRTRQIPIVKIGRRIYFEEEAVTLWIKKHMIGGIND
jgi:hypothetical protein